MINRSYPQRKRITYELPTAQFGTVILQFNQASSNEARQEIQNISDMDDKTFTKRYISKLKSRVVGYKRKRYQNKFLLWASIRKDINLVFYEISQYRYPRRKSIYDGKPQPKPEKSRQRALYNTDEFLAEKCHCSIEEVRNILTDEQIGFMIDNNTRDYYESFDTGKALNDQILRENNRQLSAQDQEILDHHKAYKEREAQYRKDKENAKNQENLS